MYKQFAASFLFSGTFITVGFEPSRMNDVDRYDLTMSLGSQKFRVRMEKQPGRNWTMCRDENYFRFKPYELQFISAILREFAAAQRNGGLQRQLVA
ncbi:MAG: hypothetical protein ABW174_05705 [Flavitalea sp.]